jgi:ABC-type transport system involved in Fe-S cluster assembly fused permease/ATPase subunit
MFNLIIGASGVKRGIMSIGDVIMIQTLMLQFLSPLFFLGSTYRNFIDTFVELK